MTVKTVMTVKKGCTAHSGRDDGFGLSQTHDGFRVEETSGPLRNVPRQPREPRQRSLYSATELIKSAPKGRQEPLPGSLERGSPTGGVRENLGIRKEAFRGSTGLPSSPPEIFSQATEHCALDLQVDEDPVHGLVEVQGAEVHVQRRRMGHRKGVLCGGHRLLSTFCGGRVDARPLGGGEGRWNLPL